jgi:hypothetical protein
VFEHRPTEQVSQLLLGRFLTSESPRNTVSDFELTLTAADAEDNLVVEVLDLSPTLNNKAMTVSLYRGSIPSDRFTPFTDSWSNSKSYFVSLSSLEADPGVYYLSVAPTVSEVKYRILARLVPAKLTDGQIVRGTVCAGEYNYHYFEKTSAMGASHVTFK